MLREFKGVDVDTFRKDLCEFVDDMVQSMNNVERVTGTKLEISPILSTVMKDIFQNLPGPLLAPMYVSLQTVPEWSSMGKTIAQSCNMMPEFSEISRFHGYTDAQKRQFISDLKGRAALASGTGTTQAPVRPDKAGSSQPSTMIMAANVRLAADNNAPENNTSVANQPKANTSGGESENDSLDMFSVILTAKMAIFFCKALGEFFRTYKESIPEEYTGGGRNGRRGRLILEGGGINTKRRK